MIHDANVRARRRAAAGGVLDPDTGTKGALLGFALLTKAFLGN
jgi:hypothetical protein